MAFQVPEAKYRAFGYEPDYDKLLAKRIMAQPELVEVIVSASPTHTDLDIAALDVGNPNCGGPVTRELN